MTSISYGQSFECDNNFGDCGTPQQSGGGGGGGGSVLIANTDLGDTYQNADDYDDDGVEDSSDNCMRIQNPSQSDRDGDGSGDACDNCLTIWNDQHDLDGDNLGDWCDDDIDGDGIENHIDDCPLHWGKEYCFNDAVYSSSQHNNYLNESNDVKSRYKNIQESELSEIDDALIIPGGCNIQTSHAGFNFFLLLALSIYRRKSKLSYCE